MLVTLQHLEMFHEHKSCSAVTSLQPSLSLNTTLPTFFWKSKHSAATPLHSIHLPLLEPYGWQMHLLSHLELSTVTSQTLSRYCSCFLGTIQKAVYENTHSFPLYMPCLMLSLWIRGLASIGNIPWDPTECVRSSDSVVSQLCSGPVMQFTRHKQVSGKLMCHIQHAPEYNADLFPDWEKDLLFQVHLFRYIYVKSCLNGSIWFPQ